MEDTAPRRTDGTGPGPFPAGPLDEQPEHVTADPMGLPHPGYTSPDFSSPGPGSTAPDEDAVGTAPDTDTEGAAPSADAGGTAPAADTAPGFSAPEFTSPGFDGPDVPAGPRLGETGTGRQLRAEQQGEDAVTAVPLPDEHRPPQPPPPAD
ncbi:hypothetical protein [Streptomyces sp. NPDC020742]|uniref:hypothetical protein n=1 Tax=unclassified Streptomyces TaxID=2593676 RepID=UPI003407DCCE